MDKRILLSISATHTAYKIACRRDDVTPMYANDGILYANVGLV